MPFWLVALFAPGVLAALVLVVLAVIVLAIVKGVSEAVAQSRAPRALPGHQRGRLEHPVHVEDLVGARSQRRPAERLRRL